MEGLVSGYGSDEEITETPQISHSEVHKHEPETEEGDDEEIDSMVTSLGSRTRSPQV